MDDTSDTSYIIYYIIRLNMIHSIASTRTHHTHSFPSIRFDQLFGQSGASNVPLGINNEVNIMCRYVSDDNATIDVSPMPPNASDRLDMFDIYMRIILIHV